ncbi:MAG TPA: hypothetical protein VGH89_24420 [Pseudonocardia sp.]|jgi:hypothetical protein
MDTQSGALGAWLFPAPANALPWRPHEESGSEQTTEAPFPPADAAELAEIRTQLDLTRARAALQRDPAWLDELSPGERAEERHAAETIRSLRRTRNLRAATATEKLNGRAQRVEGRIAAMELSDRLWSRRAATRRTRLLDPTSRLASLQRTHVASSTALISVAVAGITWTSSGVHDALVGPGGTMLAYLVEPIFSIPLLVLMGLSAQATQWNRTFPPPAHRARVYWLEAFLLMATIGMNTVSVLPGIGSWRNVATLLAHLVPPVLIVIAVTLQPMVAGFLAETLTAAEQSTAEHRTTELSTALPARAEPRLGPDTITLLALIARVNTAMTSGELQQWDNSGLPSISAIQRHLRCEKRRAQAVWDALRILTNTGHYPGGEHTTRSTTPPQARPEST